MTKPFTRQSSLDQTIKLKDVLKIIVATAIIFILIDGLMLVVWSLSGQTPVDNFFLGSFTSSLLN